MARPRGRLLTAILAGSCALAGGASTSRAGTLDAIRFGNSASESAHGVALTSAPTSTVVLGQTSRRLNVGGRMSFDLAVDGADQNYATVRFWGGDTTVNGRLFLGDQNGAFINWAQLDDSSSAQSIPSHWHYATVPLPRSMTDGQSSVRLSLYAMNDNSSYSNPPPAGAQTANSRPMYSIFSHAGSRYDVSDGVLNTAAIAPYDYGNYVKPSGGQMTSYVNNLKSIANGIATQVANMQVTNTAGLPSSLLGAFDIRTGADNAATLNATHSHHISTDNLGPLRGATILAHSYNMPGGVYQGNANTLDRIAWGIDYARRVQGATGGYVDVWQPIQWTGGPNRTDASGSLEGVTHQEIAKAFLMTRSAMESAGLLDQLVDDDNNAATPTITRRQAYTDLFREFVDFHSGYFGGWNGSNAPRDRGHAPNQDLYQVGGMAWAMEALESLDDDAFSPGNAALSHANAQAALKARAYEAAGVTLTPFNNSWWFSPDGLPLEAGGLKGGGYSSEYGQRQSEEIWDLAQFLDDPADRAPMLEMAENAASVWQNFWYPIYRTGGTIDTRLEGAINWRNSKISGAGEQWFPAQFAALSTNGIADPAVIRALQLAFMNNELHLAAPRGGHFWQDGVWIMEQVEQLETLLADLPSTNELPANQQRLPFEAGQPDFAWIDSFGGAAAIRHGDDFIYMALNWHHGSSGSNPVSNNIVRIHEITPLDDRIVTAVMENPFGFGELYRVHYGDYLLGVNADGISSYLLDVPTANGWLRDLVSGELRYVTNGSLTLPAGQSVVLLLDQLIQGPSADFNHDGIVNATDLAAWKGAFGPTAGADADGDGDSDGDDFLAWQRQLGSSVTLATAASVSVPEPDAMVVACLTAAIGVATSRRRVLCSTQAGLGRSAFAKIRASML